MIKKIAGEQLFEEYDYATSLIHQLQWWRLILCRNQAIKDGC